MSQMKAMSTTIEIIIIIVVILVAALTVLAIFSGGINNAFGVISDWITGAGNTPLPGPPCTQTCQPAICNPGTQIIVPGTCPSTSAGLPQFCCKAK